MRTHGDAPVRARALAILTGVGERSLQDEARALLDAEDASARLSAVRYLCRFGTPEDADALHARLYDSNASARETGHGRPERVATLAGGSRRRRRP